MGRSTAEFRLNDLNQAKKEVTNDQDTVIQILRKGKIQDIKIATGQIGIAIEEIYDESVSEIK